MSAQTNQRYFYPPPLQPDCQNFLRELMQPLHAEKIRWERRNCRRSEISLAGGVALDLQIPDPAGLLTTALQDFTRFLQSAGIPADAGYPLRIVPMPQAVPEAYRIDIGKDRGLVQVADIEAVRRALVFLEDEMLRLGGPLLRVGRVAREPVIRRRIAFHVEMFERAGQTVLPDEFLNRWAHDGINGVMLHLDSLFPYRLVPEFEHPPEALFQTLSQMVRNYARYGIRLYLYLNEPKSFPAGSPLRSRYPQLLGGDGRGLTYYCTGTKQGCDFLAEGFRKLVAGVPGLGGLIVICVGERPTHCYSGGYEPQVRPIRCPRCSQRAPRDVLRETLAAMARGVHAADPAAEFIAWPYSQYLCWGERLTRDAASHVPPNAILMHNFDSAARVRQLGKMRRADDYWLSVPGPSALFRDCARLAHKQGTRVFAKIMAGCSHELASVPYVPVPGNLYRRFRAMHALGVSGVLQNWGSGNDPSLMNRAAGTLAFAPLPASEEVFLEQHARRDWGRHARTVARAWKHFQSAYDHCPVAIGFSYYGPVHNGPVWPLYLEPRGFELGGNWRPDQPGGDVIGGCTGYHTLAEVIILCTRMRDRWRRGVRLMESLRHAAAGNNERQAQIGLVQAVQLQLESAVNILSFYALRERLAWQRSGNRKALLAKMKILVEREIEVDRRLLPLATRFPRLGFCPEANSHKYFPAQIRWRMRELKRLVAREFPRVEARIRPGLPLFPAYTGEEPAGYVYRCRRLERPPSHEGRPVGGAWDAMEEAPPFDVPERQRNNGRATTWKAGYTSDALYLGFICREPHMERLRADPHDPNDLGPDDQVHVSFFSSQFEESRGFLINAAGAREYFAGRAMNDIDPRSGGEWLRAMGAPGNFRWTARSFRGDGFWSLSIRFPLAALGLKRGHLRPLRFDMGRAADLLGDQEFQTLLPANKDATGGRFGWLVFD